MKPTALIIAASMSLNAALLGYVGWKSSQAATPASPTSASAETPVAPRAVPAKTPGGDVGALIESGDLAALRDRLRAEGVPDDMVRDIVRTRLWKSYEARLEALRPRQEAKQAWWKYPQDIHDPFEQNKDASRQLMALRRQLEAEQRDLLGPEPEEEVDPGLAFLSSEKREKLRAIEADYRELQEELQAEIGGFTLPSDLAKLRLLQEEQKRDIYAVMTPEEQRDYELRNSTTAQNMRWEMSRLDVSEKEYLQIYALQKAFDERYPENDPFGLPDAEPPRIDWDARAKEESILKEKIRAVIGEERYGNSLKTQDNDYRQLKEATRRFDLPADTPDRIYALRSQAEIESRKIAENPALSIEDRKKALDKLATAVRSQVNSGLGAEIGEAYLQSSMRWLGNLQRGETIQFARDGTHWDSQPVDGSGKAPLIRVEEAPNPLR